MLHNALTLWPSTMLIRSSKEIVFSPVEQMAPQYLELFRDVQERGNLPSPMPPRPSTNLATAMNAPKCVSGWRIEL